MFHSVPRLTFVLAAVGSMAWAQGTAVQVGPDNHDTNQPVEVTSDTLSVANEDGVAIFEGNVVVIQGAMRLAAPKVRVEYTENTTDGTTDIDRMHATGGVTYANGEDAAESKEAVYLPDTGDLEMTGDVLLTQGSSIMSGAKLVVDLDTGTGVMQGRVRSVFRTGTSTNASGQGSGN